MFLVGWVGACAGAAAIGASLSGISLAPGPVRLIIDGLIVGVLQGVALRGLVRFRYWVALSVSGIALGVIAAVVGVVVAGLALAPLGNDNPVYVGTIYVVGALLAGLVVAFIQGGALPQDRRLAPWLAGSACGAPFIFPAVLLSWFAPENVTAPVPPLIVGLLGGLVYGVLSGVGLHRALNVRDGSRPQ